MLLIILIIHYQMNTQGSGLAVALKNAVKEISYLKQMLRVTN